ncbi:MAG: SEL1-like repeat protein [Hyphomicrobiaceae bacterium]
MTVAVARSVLGQTKMTADLETIEAAENGVVSAQIALGWAYSQYGDLERDDVLAKQWLRKASQSGDLMALRRLARLLLDANEAETVLLSSELVNRRDFYGHYLMGHILADELCGAKPDKEAAFEHLLSAGNMGHLTSRADLTRLKATTTWQKLIAIGPMLALALRIAYRRSVRPSDLSTFT